jgi:hypothetical protein
MKQNKTLHHVLILSVSLLLLGGCGRDESHLWMKTQQASRLSENRLPQLRTPAESQPRCFADRFQDSLILQDVQKMEASYSNGKSDHFQHGELAFEQLPQATIDALKVDFWLDTESTKTKSWIAVDSKQKNCKDLSCFIDSLYVKPANEGLLNYWYYLKTGYVLAASKNFTWHDEIGRVPTISIEGVPLEDLLYDRNELKAFWFAANLLPKSMLHMPSLSVIHRYPRGKLPESWKNGTCAWASGYAHGGEVLVSDPCLTVNTTNVFDQSQFFYQATTHEFGHRLARWNYSKQGEPAVQLDEAPEFLALSGWIRDSLPQPNGNYKYHWNDNGSLKGWQSSYARTSPAEDFADAVGLYRNSPNRLNVLAPAKYQFIKNRVFDHVGYTVPELKTQYTTAVKEALIEKLDQWIEPCVTGKTIALASSKAEQNLANLAKVNLPIDSKVKTCIQRQIASATQDELNLLRYNEPEACIIMSNFDAEIASGAVTEAVPELNEYMKSSEALTDLIVGVQDYRSAILREFDSRALVLACWQQADPRECYSLKIDAEYSRLYQKFKILLSSAKGDVSDIERKRFMVGNSYDRIFAEVTSFYQGLFSPFSGSIRTRADQLFTECLTVAPRANTDVLLTPFTAGAAYVAPAIMQCLNEKISSEMSELRAEVGNAQNVSFISSDAQSWINEKIIFPGFKTELDSRIATESKAEQLKLETKKIQTIDSVYATLIQNNKWKSDGYAYPQCKTLANLKLQVALSANAWKFLATDSMLDQWGDLICEKVRAWVIAEARAGSRRNQAAQASNLPVSQGPIAPTESQKSELDRVWKLFQPLFASEMQTRFEHCQTRAYFGQRLKRFCLFTEWVVDGDDQYRKTAWNWGKDRAARKFSQLPELRSFMIEKHYSESELFELIRSRAEDERQKIADQVLELFYGAKDVSQTEN